MEISDVKAVESGYDNAFKRVTEGDRSETGWGWEKFMSYANLYKPEEGKE